MAEQNPDAQIDLHEVGSDQAAVDDDSGGDEHPAPPGGHVLVLKVARHRILERTPARQQHPPPPHRLVAGQRFVKEVEQVVVHRHDALHEVDVLHEPGQIVGEDRHRGNRPDAARVQRGRMDVPSLHQTEHLTRQTTHLKRFEVELALERVERSHDVGDRAIPVQGGMRGVRSLRAVPYGRIGFAHHLFAEIDADQIFLEQVVVEHELGGFAEIDDPVGQHRRVDAEGHVLRVAGARRVVVAANAADPAADEVSVSRILAFHEDAVSAEDRGGAVALHDFALVEIDFCMNAEAADDPGDGIPRHVNETRVRLWHRARL